LYKILFRITLTQFQSRSRSKYIRGKNGFAERSKILAEYRKIILLNRENYVERSN